jgi:hypothetical protein
MNDEEFNRAINWFWHDIKEQVDWSYADVSDERILEIALEKVYDFQHQCLGK